MRKWKMTACFGGTFTAHNGQGSVGGKFYKGFLFTQLC